MSWRSSCGVGKVARQWGTRAPPHSGTPGSFNSRTIQGARLWAVSCDQHITAIVHRRSPKMRGVCAWLTDRVKSELCIACTGSWWCPWGSPPGLSGAPTVCHTVSKDMQLLCVFVSPLTMEVLNNGACNGPRTRVFSDLLWGPWRRRCREARPSRGEMDSGL